MTAASWEFIPNTVKDSFVQTVRVDNQLQPVVLLSFENRNLNQFLHHHSTGDVTVDVSDFLKEKATMLTNLFQHPIPTCKQPYQCIMGVLRSYSGILSLIGHSWGCFWHYKLMIGHWVARGAKLLQGSVWHSVVLQCDSLCTSDFWVFVFPCVQYSRIIICTNVLTVRTAHFV